MFILKFAAVFATALNPLKDDSAACEIATLQSEELTYQDLDGRL